MAGVAPSPASFSELTKCIASSVSGQLDPGAKHELDELKSLAILHAASSAPQKYFPAPPVIVRRWEAEPIENPSARIAAARPELGLTDLPMLPTPKVSRSNQEGWRGRTYSYKSGGMVAWNGRLAWNALMFADADASVERLIYRPLTVSFLINGKPRRHTFDLLLVRRDEISLVDCVWERTAQAENAETHAAEIGLACAQLGYNYEILTERFLEEPVRARNIRAISRARQEEPPSSELILRARELARRAPHTILSLARALGCDERSIFRLIISRHLAVDLAVCLEESAISLLGTVGQ